MRLNRSGLDRRRFALSVFLGFLIVWPTVSLGHDTVSSLMRLVPPDSPLILTVENLREHYPAFISSSLAEGLARLPAVRDWMESTRCKKLVSARGKIEAFLGTPIAEIRDAIFGDAVVLALNASSNIPLGRDRPTGVLLLRARNRELLQRLIRLIDDAQVAGGELARCFERREGETVYVVREYPAAAKRPAEYHVDFPDGTFALSNSEGLIREVINRRNQIDSKTGEIKELAGLPGFQVVHRRLPEAGKAACRLFVDHRLLERIWAEVSHPAKPSDAPTLALIGRYVAAIDYAGVALTWQDGVLAIQTAESIDPAKLDPAIVRWAKDPRPVDPGLAQIPSTAFALACTGIDCEAFNILLGQLIPEEQKPRLETLEVALSGILLGQDLHRRIFPAIGPSWIAYFDAPEESDPTPRFISSVPLVVAVSLQDRDREATKDSTGPEHPGLNGDHPGVTTAAAVDNALRTILAIIAIDHKRNKGQNRIVSREVAGAQVTALDTPIPFAYSVDRIHGRLVLGNSAHAVARYVESSADPNAGSRFRKIRAIATTPAANNPRTFVGLDLRALYDLADRRRDQLAQILAERRQRPEAEPARDLDQVLALIRLFDSAFATSRVEPDATSCVRRIGLVARPDAGSTASPTNRP